MKLRGLFGSMVAGLASMAGRGAGAPSTKPSGNERRDFTMPLTLPSRRTAPRHRKGRRTAEQIRLKSERRRSSIGVRAWHTGPVQSVPFAHSNIRHETKQERKRREKWEREHQVIAPSMARDLRAAA